MREECKYCKYHKKQRKYNDTSYTESYTRFGHHYVVTKRKIYKSCLQCKYRLRIVDSCVKMNYKDIPYEYQMKGFPPWCPLEDVD